MTAEAAPPGWVWGRSRCLGGFLRRLALILARSLSLSLILSLFFLSLFFFLFFPWSLPPGFFGDFSKSGCVSVLALAGLIRALRPFCGFGLSSAGFRSSA